jgi:hypothetical protein
MPMFVAVPAEAVVRSGPWDPASVNTPAVETFKLEALTANVPVPLPIATFPEVEAKVVVPVEVRVVNVPAAAVVAPIAVELIPVEVVLKWPDVKLMSAPPVVEIEDAVRPERVRAPEVAVKFNAPVVKVKPLEAVKVWETVKAPLFVVVLPVAPMFIAWVFDVPMLIEPLVVVPVPAWMLTEPPVEVVPDSLPAVKFKAPPVAELLLFTAGWSEREFPPVRVVMSGELLPLSARTPFSLIVSLLTPPD